MKIWLFYFFICCTLHIAAKQKHDWRNYNDLPFTEDKVAGFDNDLRKWGLWHL